MAKVAVHKRTDGHSRGTRIRVREDRFQEDKKKELRQGEEGVTLEYPNGIYRAGVRLLPAGLQLYPG